MTFIVNKNGVKNTESTEVTVGAAAKVTVGGNFENTGKVKVFEGGRLEVNKDLINSGDIIINDPERVKQVIIEALKTTQNITEFGTELLKKLGLFNIK